MEAFDEMSFGLIGAACVRACLAPRPPRVIVNYLGQHIWFLLSDWDRFSAGGFMHILAAIKREERKLEKQLGRLENQLSGVRAAAKALGHSAEREVIGVKKRVLSAAGRAAIVKAAKKRWAKVKKQAKKAAR
jgi:hypothetical protein